MCIGIAITSAQDRSLLQCGLPGSLKKLFLNLDGFQTALKSALADEEQLL